MFITVKVLAVSYAKGAFEDPLLSLSRRSVYSLELTPGFLVCLLVCGPLIYYDIFYKWNGYLNVVTCLFTCKKCEVKETWF